MAKVIIQFVLPVLAALLVTVICGGVTKYPIRNIVTIEDHPWVIRNETCLKTTGNNSCLSPCYYGLLIDILHRIEQDLKSFNNCKIHTVNSFGVLDSKGSWSGLIGELAKNKSDMGLSVLGITPERKKVISFSYPVINSTTKNVTLALGFPKGSKLEAEITNTVKKLVNQRHIEQLVEKWFNEAYEDAWSEKKQLTKYLNKRINKRPKKQ